MKNEKRIIAYLDNQMSNSEAKAFEEELKNSQELKTEFEEYKKFFFELDELKNIPVQENYFLGIIPSFRRKHEKRKTISLYPKYAYGFIVIVIVFIISYFLFNRDSGKTNPSIENIVSNLNEDELTQLLNTYQDDYGEILIRNGYENQDSLLDKMIINELNLSNNSDRLLSSYSEDLNYVFDNLNDEEAEIIYNEILNKNFF